MSQADTASEGPFRLYLQAPPPLTVKRNSFREWLKVIGALIVRDIQARRGPGQVLTTLLLLAEPILAVMIFATLFLFLEKRPSYGPSQYLFHGSGVLPFYLFLRLSIRGKANLEKHRRRFPPVKILDEFMAKCILNFVIMSVSTVLFFWAVAEFDTKLAEPSDLAACVFAWLTVAAIGCGLGLLNSVISGVFPLWSFIMHVTTRGLMVLSGVFYVFALMPAKPRSILSWNPLIHCLEWFRSGFYPSYPTFVVDRTYAFSVAIILLIFSLAIERETRRHGI